VAALKMAQDGLCLDEAEYGKALFSVDHNYDVNNDRDSDGSGPEPDDWDEDHCFSPGDLLGKAFALVKQMSLLLSPFFSVPWLTF
jgi:hypothetical protein